ncbi:hypothetical protein PENTCL1PPCAC_5321, partial [Pristionchus entomophagus]
AGQSKQKSSGPGAASAAASSPLAPGLPADPSFPGAPSGPGGPAGPAAPEPQLQHDCCSCSACALWTSWSYEVGSGARGAAVTGAELPYPACLFTFMGWSLSTLRYSYLPKRPCVSCLQKST